MHMGLLRCYPGPPHIELRPLGGKFDVIVMNLSSLDTHMGEPHVRGAAACAISLEDQEVTPGFAAVDPQVIKAVHRIGQLDVRGRRTRPVSGRIGDHKLSRGEPPVSDSMLMFNVWAAAEPGKMVRAVAVKRPSASQADILVTRFMAISAGKFCLGGLISLLHRVPASAVRRLSGAGRHPAGA
jgi:hypothetical protein